MQNFFYRFVGMNLTPGNKSAGFVLEVATQALLDLSRLPVTQEEQFKVLERARERIVNAGLMGKRAVKNVCLRFHELTGCPRFFFTDDMFGGSIGADPETFGRFERKDVLDYLGPSVDYTPHNVDTPKQALVLMLLAQTWAEWAHSVLRARADELTGVAPPLEAIEAVTDTADKRLI